MFEHGTELRSDHPPHPLTRGQRDRALLKRRRIILTTHFRDFPTMRGSICTAMRLLPINPTLRALRVITDPDVHDRTQQRLRRLFLLVVAHFSTPTSYSYTM